MIIPAPALTIYIPAYNAETRLAATMNSLLEQSFRDYELILVDDGSVDKTPAIAQAYAEKDARVRLIRCSHRGEVAARNTALGAAHPSTRYFLNHDADDISSPTKLDRLVRHLESHPKVGIAGTFAEYFNDQGDRVGRPPLEFTPERIRATFHRVNSMINSASMIRRQVFQMIGGYREAYRTVDDYDFFARALLAGFCLENLPETLHLIRLHAGSIGNTHATLQQQRARQVQAFYAAHRDSPERVIIQSPLILSQEARGG